MTLAQYIRKRNGVPFGHSGALRNMLLRSLGARNFSTFWNYWNPIFGYYLGRMVFKPLSVHLHPAVALVVTFVASGLLHDMVTTVFRGSISLFFSIWFFFMAMGVLLSKSLGHNFSHRTWVARALINLLFIGACLAITLYLEKQFVAAYLAGKV